MSAVVAAAVVLGSLAPGCDRSGSDMDLFNIKNYTAAPYAEVIKAAEIGGRINYRLVAEGYLRPLDKYLELAAAQGPQTRRRIFPQEEHRASYYLNVYHALVIRMWLEHGAADHPVGLQLDPAWLDEEKYTVDGVANLSINDVADLARSECHALDLEKRDRGEVGPRTRDTLQLVEFALNPGTADGPPIPSPPFREESFELSLNNHVRNYLGRPETFRRTPEGFSAPDVLGRISDRVPRLVSFVDAYTPVSLPDKLDLLEAVEQGRLSFRQRDRTLALPRSPGDIPPPLEPAASPSPADDTEPADDPNAGNNQAPEESAATDDAEPPDDPGEQAPPPDAPGPTPPLAPAP